MQKMNPSHGFETMIRALRFLELRLARYPELAEFRDQVVAHRRKLTEDHGVFADAQEQRIVATAELNVLDDLIDATAVIISQSAHAMFNRDREDPRYKKAFPVTASNMTSGVGGERQERFIANLCATLKSDDAYSPLRDRGLELERLSEQLKQAQARRQDLWQQEAAARVAYGLTADETRRTYNALYHQFMIRMPSRASEIETLFLRLTSAARRAPGDAPVIDEPAAE